MNLSRKCTVICFQPYTYTSQECRVRWQTISGRNQPDTNSAEVVSRQGRSTVLACAAGSALGLSWGRSRRPSRLYFLEIDSQEVWERFPRKTLHAQISVEASGVMTPSAGQSGSTNHRALPSSVLFCKFIQSIPDNQLVRQKLNCMTKIVESNLFQQLGKLLLFMEIPVSRLLQIHLPFFFFFKCQ